MQQWEMPDTPGRSAQLTCDVITSDVIPQPVILHPHRRAGSTSTSSSCTEASELRGGRGRWDAEAAPRSTQKRLAECRVESRRRFRESNEAHTFAVLPRSNATARVAGRRRLWGCISCRAGLAARRLGKHCCWKLHGDSAGWRRSRVSIPDVWNDRWFIRQTEFIEIQI